MASISLFLAVAALSPAMNLALDFYIDPEATMKLYGVKTRGIYYISNGVVNAYAMNFKDQIIPYQVNELVFHWRAPGPAQEPAAAQDNEEGPLAAEEGSGDAEVVAPRPRNEEPNFGNEVTYSIHVLYTPGPAMDRPELVNVTSVGVVPKEDTTFGVRFQCTGRVTAEVNFLMQIKFILSQHRTETLNFKRKKVCLASDSREFVEQGAGAEVPTTRRSPLDVGDKVDKKGGRRRPPAAPAGSTTMLALGAAAGAVALLAILLSVMYLTKGKRIPQTAFGSSTINLRSHEEPASGTAAMTVAYGYNSLTVEKQLRANSMGRGIHVDRIANPAMMSRAVGCRGSYATLASFTNVPVNAPIAINQSQRSNGRSSATLRDPVMTQRWLEHYNRNCPPGSGAHNSNSLMFGGSNPRSSRCGSLWSSSSNSAHAQSSLQRLQRASQHHPFFNKAASQNSIFAECPDLAPNMEKTPIPRPNALIMENGVPKLAPPSASITSSSTSTTQNSSSSNNNTTSSSRGSSSTNNNATNFQHQRILNNNNNNNSVHVNDNSQEVGVAATGDVIKRAVHDFRATSEQPFYQNLGTINRLDLTMSHSTENIYSELAMTAAASGNNANSAGGTPRRPAESSRDDLGDFSDLDCAVSGPYAMYTPQIYPHLMPQNFMQAQSRRVMPRSSSGGSVLV